MNSGKYVKKIALFGGSFDPIQKAHQKMVSYCLNHNLSDEIWLIPSKYHAFKGQIKSVSEKHRIKMIDLALAGLSYRVFDIELKKEKTSYTIDTLKELKEKFSVSHFNLIIGDDNLQNFFLWKSYEEIFDYADLLCFSRSKRNKLPSELKSFKKQIMQINNFNIDVSSSEIRKRIKKKIDFQNLLHYDVFEYIKLNHLYE